MARRDGGDHRNFSARIRAGGGTWPADSAVAPIGNGLGGTRGSGRGLARVDGRGDLATGESVDSRLESGGRFRRKLAGAAPLPRQLGLGDCGCGDSWMGSALSVGLDV